MSNPQWMKTLSLALETPFDSNEETIWSKLFDKYNKFGEVFISSLSTIDIVRLPFIEYSIIKYYFNKDSHYQNMLEKVYLAIQNEFQIHMRQRAIAEILDLQKEDNTKFKDNLDKLKEKISDLSLKYTENNKLPKISEFLANLKQEIKELEENASKEKSE